MSKLRQRAMVFSQKTTTWSRARKYNPKSTVQPQIRRLRLRVQQAKQGPETAAPRVLLFPHLHALGDSRTPSKHFLRVTLWIHINPALLLPWVALSPLHGWGSRDTDSLGRSKHTSPGVGRLLAPVPETDLALRTPESQAQRRSCFGEDRDSPWHPAKEKHISRNDVPSASPHKLLNSSSHPGLDSFY